MRINQKKKMKDKVDSTSAEKKPKSSKDTERKQIYDDTPKYFCRNERSSTKPRICIFHAPKILKM